ADLQLRDAVADGYLPGPEILAVGVYVKHSPGNPLLTDQRLFKYINQPVLDAAAVRDLVRINADNGVDWIKTQTGGTASLPGGWDPKTEFYDPEIIQALVQEA
ncbi:MAG: amidohydrolase family protein, partial [Gammaproteobacteria bacterium]|nr:amidohydrolase family protein [Gammaproteobacteria bacterium]NIO61042.1 amidohydrolase family protein [Gammaproteobacteria bacterium]NIT39990.1 amidohydrolase family protein [Gammaproteobacteria bacterium]